MQPAWPFTGFGNPIKDSPEWNRSNAGHEVTLRFGLGGDRGLAIFAASSRSWVELSCAIGDATGAATPVSSNDLDLRYQKGPDRYPLRIATSAAWAGTCRQLDLKLADGSRHSVRFSFR